MPLRYLSSESKPLCFVPYSSFLNCLQTLLIWKPKRINFKQSAKWPGIFLHGNPLTGRFHEWHSSFIRVSGVYGRFRNDYQIRARTRSAYFVALHTHRHTSLGLSLFIVRAIPTGASGNTKRGLPVTQPNASVASLIQGAHPSEASFSSYRPTGYTRLYVHRNDHASRRIRTTRVRRRL